MILSVIGTGCGPTTGSPLLGAAAACSISTDAAPSTVAPAVASAEPCRKERRDSPGSTGRLSSSTVLRATTQAASWAGGAMNSGPTGLGMQSDTMLSIIFSAAASSFQPMTSATGSSCSGWRAPQSAMLSGC